VTATERRLREGYEFVRMLANAPLELEEFSHGFDDKHLRFHILYCAELSERCLREVLADFQPNLGALRQHFA